MFQCRDSELATKVAEALGYGSWMNRKFSLRQLCNSPYTYGCDIETEVLIKQGYIDKTPVGEMATFTSGCLDIENEVRGEGRINAITYIHEHDIYTAVLDEYCRIYNKDTKQLDDIVYMRSNNVCEYSMDSLWQVKIYERVINRLISELDDNICPGHIYWNVGSLHLYEEDFKFLSDKTKIANEIKYLLNVSRLGKNLLNKYNEKENNI
jgi:hypothetical protein